jgi:hypothetical protein
MAIIYKPPYAKYVSKYEKPVRASRIGEKRRDENRARVRKLVDELLG